MIASLHYAPLALSLLLAAAPALAQQSPRFGIDGVSLGSGGGHVESEAFGMAGTLGQTVAPTDASSASFALDGGAVSFDVPIDIDIQPGGTPNAVNLDRRGRLPVAILTTPRFDALRVDTRLDETGRAKIRLAGAYAETRRGALVADYEDVDLDGDLDLSIRFPVMEIDPSRLLESDAGANAVLSAVTWSGTPLRGLDSIVILGD